METVINASSLHLLNVLLTALGVMLAAATIILTGVAIFVAILGWWGYKGQGVRVGVISDGDTNYPILRQASILPAHVPQFGSRQGRSDEGDWMMQVVHNIAPKARLAFCDPYDMPVYRCARWLADRFHANVITDDMNAWPIFWAPSPKTLGYRKIIKDHPNLLFVIGSGNFGGGYYEGRWVPIPWTWRGRRYEAQDFGRSVGEASTPYDSFVVPAHRSVEILLGLDTKPSSDGLHCPQTNPTFRLILFGRHGTVVASRTQSCPLFHLIYHNQRTTSRSLRVAVVAEGSFAAHLRLKLAAVAAHQRATVAMPLRFHTQGATANTGLDPHVLIVAGVDPNTLIGHHCVVEHYASAGPLRLAYRKTRDGTGRLVRSFSARKVPDIVVPDRFVVAMPTRNGIGYAWQPFIGDSGAGPAAAGVVALLLSAHIAAARIKTLLEATAHPHGHAGRWNPRYGYGFIDADRAAVRAGVVQSLRRTHGGPAVPLSLLEMPDPFHPSPRFLRDDGRAQQALQGNARVLARLQTAARDGHTSGAFWLAYYDFKTRHLPSAAWRFWVLAQGSRFAPAENWLAMLFENGAGLERDYRAAYVWSVRAARAGMGVAMARLAPLLFYGLGVSSNWPEAFGLLRAARLRGIHFTKAESSLYRRLARRLPAFEKSQAKHWAVRVASRPWLIPRPYTSPRGRTPY